MSALQLKCQRFPRANRTAGCEKLKTEAIVKVRSSVLAALLALVSVPQQQPSGSPRSVAADLRTPAAAGETRTPKQATPPDGLQKALKAGGEIHLQTGVTYSMSIVVRVSGTSIYYDGATSHPVFGPALEIPPGVNDVQVFDFNGITDGVDRVILCGHNDRTQTTLDLVPKNIRFVRTTIPAYAGKRGIEVNCAAEIDTATITMNGKRGQDTQGIGVANTPGPVRMHGITITGGVESVMVGGDTIKIPGVYQSDITMEDFTLTHPVDWRGQGYGIKDLLELKACVRCIFRRGTLDGSFRDAQVGWAIVVTPRNGAIVQDVLFEDLKIRNAAGVINILGRSDNPPPTPEATSKIVLRRIDAVVAEELGRAFESTQPSSMGIFALIGGGVNDMSIEDSTFVGDGPSFINVYAGDVITADGTKVKGDPMERLSVTGSTFPALKYGFMLFGVPHAGPTQKGVQQLTVIGNTITGAAPALKKNLPKNTFQ